MLSELATKVVKYGALSNLYGHINIAWTIDGGPDKPSLVLAWRESNLDVAPPARRGFGSELIEGVVSYDFGGTGTLEFKAERTGLRAETVAVQSSVRQWR